MSAPDPGAGRVSVMRIGFFADSYRPYVSGVVQSIDTFADELRRRGHFVQVFAPSYPHSSAIDDEYVYRFPSFHTPFYPEFYIGMPIPWPAMEYVRSLQLDIIHAHSPFLLGQLGALFAKQFRVPLVFTYHTLYEQYVHYFPFARGLSQKTVLTVAKQFCNRCDLVVTPTRVIQQLLQTYGVNRQIVPIPTGIEIAMFESGAPGLLRERFRIGPEQQILLFIGRLGKEKNLDSLFRIFSRVLEQDSNVILLLAGSGPAEDELHDLAQQMGIGSKVVFTGRLSRAEVASAYRGADLFVFPSVTETQGLVLVEAMAAGLVVVASSASVSEEIVEDGSTGFLCAGEDGFVERIMMLLQEPGLKKRISTAAAARAGNLTADRMAIRLERAYQALLAGDRQALETMSLDRL